MGWPEEQCYVGWRSPKGKGQFWWKHLPDKPNTPTNGELDWSMQRYAQDVGRRLIASVRRVYYRSRSRGGIAHCRRSLQGRREGSKGVSYLGPRSVGGAPRSIGVRQPVRGPVSERSSPGPQTGSQRAWKSDIYDYLVYTWNVDRASLRDRYCLQQAANLINDVYRSNQSIAMHSREYWY